MTYNDAYKNCKDCGHVNMNCICYELEQKENCSCLNRKYKREGNKVKEKCVICGKVTNIFKKAEDECRG